MDQSFRTQPHMGQVYSIMDLTQLQFTGDANMADFRFMWDTILDRMRDRLDERTLQELLVDKSKTSVALKEDIMHYYRVERGHKDHSYIYLRTSMDRYIERRQQEKNREMNRQMVKGQGIQPLAPAVGTQSQAQPKAKGKGKAFAQDGPSSSSDGKQGTGKGGAKDGSLGPKTSQAVPKSQSITSCWYFHHGGGCKKGKDGYFSHQAPKK